MLLRFSFGHAFKLAVLALAASSQVAPTFASTCSNAEEIHLYFSHNKYNGLFSKEAIADASCATCAIASAHGGSQSVAGQPAQEFG
jgi:hypothetical protein